MTLTYVSVCSGIEAATVAWHPLGWRPLAFAEVDKFPSAVLAHHYPHVPNLGDITKFKEWPDARFDLLVGGTPCQAFSIAGLRQGFADARGNLTLTYCAILARYRPSWFLWENVPGVLSVDGGRAFGSFLGAVAELGYGFAYRVLDAQYVRVDGFPRAVPQRRRRVFVVGHLGDWRRPAAVLFEPESVRGDSPPRRQARQDVAGALGAGSARSGGRVGRREAAASHLVASPLDASFARLQGASGQDLNHGHSHLIAFGGNDTSGPIDVATARNAHSGPHGRLDFESETFVAHTLKTRGRAGSNAADQETYIAFHGSQNPDVSGDVTHPLGRNQGQEVCVAFAENSRAELRYEGGDGRTVSALKVGGGKPGQSYPAIAFDMRGREHGSQMEGPHDTANIRAASGGSSRSYVAQTWGVRRLMPVECERLQGFPDGYTAIPYRGKLAADGPRYKALGNSMAVPCMRWIGRRIEMVRNAIGDHHA